MADDRAKVIALVEKLRELDEDHQTKRTAIMSELSFVLAGGEGVGPKLKRIFASWDHGWMETTQSETHFDFAAEKGGRGQVTLRVKKWLTEGVSEAVIIAKMLTYFSRPDRYAQEQRYPFWLFARLFNTLQGSSRVNGVDPASDTRDRLQGLRGHDEITPR